MYVLVLLTCFAPLSHLCHLLSCLEMARRERQRKTRRQRWIWGSITTAIVLGTTAIAWSYLPSSKGSTSADHDQVSEPDDGAK